MRISRSRHRHAYNIHKKCNVDVELRHIVTVCILYLSFRLCLVLCALCFSRALARVRACGRVVAFLPVVLCVLCCPVPVLFRCALRSVLSGFVLALSLLGLLALCAVGSVVPGSLAFCVY